MEIYYRESGSGGDFARIDGMTIPRKCVSHDTCGARCDSLEIEFENAGGWYSWGPKEDDEILVSLTGYNTGIMYLNTILPEDGKYRILATALPCKARRKEYRSYKNKTLEDIMRACALRTGMSFQIFGIDEKTVIPYIEQENESAAAFLHRLLKWEGAALKCVNGNYTAIGYEYAQRRAAHQTIEISAQQRGTEYRRGGAKLKTVTIKTPYARASAEDLNAAGVNSLIISDLPAMNDFQAGRWARNILRHHNLQSENLTMDSIFNPGMTAMTRIDVTGGTDAAGEWLIMDAEHDFFNKTTKVRMQRCVNTVQ